MGTFRSLLSQSFGPYGDLSAHQLDLLEQHFALMMRWNRKINLTRITELLEVVQFHYCESLYLANELPKIPLRVVDIGAGAGFPGIPLAVLRPDCSVNLVESHQRKAVFLREAARQLENVEVIAARAEECSQSYDWCISRAVRAEDVVRLRLASNFAILTSGTAGIKLPWGLDRRLQLFHVERQAT